MDKYQAVQAFLNVALKNQAIEAQDMIYQRNKLLNFLGMTNFKTPAQLEDSDALIVADALIKIAKENDRFSEENAEFYEAALMDFITPLPSKINQIFWQNYEKSPESATDYFSKLASEVNQVKKREIAKNIAFMHASKYGDLEITINLSKPEKDPKAIAAAKLAPKADYPDCVLCMENEGLYGSENQPARSNHRIIRFDLNGENWGLQYSPYAYYNEHSILLNASHQPMEINRRTFENLLEFLDLFPHYMIGSNADLPIVGGSILSHDHYQAGRHDFPMAKAKVRENFSLSAFPEISGQILHWPLSVMRLKSKDKSALLTVSEQILKKWKLYSDEALSIVAESPDGISHHTITPIARKSGNHYEMDLVLRDNNVSEAHPSGIFHPHQKLHHIKKENIGLIEVMGLAILPARLQSELIEVEKFLLGQTHEMKEIHREWAKELLIKEKFSADNVTEKVRKAVGEVFEEVLQDAGVYKDDKIGHEGFRKFIKFVNEDE